MSFSINTGRPSPLFLHAGETGPEGRVSALALSNEGST